MAGTKLKTASQVTLGDPRRQVRVRRINFFLKVALLPILVLTLYGLVFELYVSTCINLVGGLCWAISWYLLHRKGRVDAACWFFLSGITFIIAVSAALGQQIRSDLLWLLPMVPMGSYFILPKRQTRYCALGCAALILSIWYIESMGWFANVEVKHGWPETLAIRVAALIMFTQFGLESTKISDTQIRDLNQEQEKLEASRRQAERAKMSKSAFLATMSHEIRTPMNGILGMTDHLLNRERPAQQREAIEMIRQCSEGLMMLLNDILDVSKLDVDKLKFEQQPFDLVQCAHSSLDRYLNHRSDTTPQIRFENSQDAIWVNADKKRLGQIMDGLLSSAVRANQGSGQVRFCVQSAPMPDKEDWLSVTLEVHDERPRLAQLDQSLILRSHESRELDPGEIAQNSDILGLALCRRLVKAMHGVFELEEQQLSETCFRVRLELPSAQPQKSSTNQRDLESLSLADRGLTVLVVDDNAVNRKVAGLVLEKLGVEPFFAQDGLDAVKQAGQRSFDLILMDLRMPKLSGFDACQAIRGEAGPNQHTPVVALSANIGPEDRVACQAAGMAGCLAKPFRAEQLAALIDQTLTQPSTAA